MTSAKASARFAKLRIRSSNVPALLSLTAVARAFSITDSRRTGRGQGLQLHGKPFGGTRIAPPGSSASRGPCGRIANDVRASSDGQEPFPALRRRVTESAKGAKRSQLSPPLPDLLGKASGPGFKECPGRTWSPGFRSRFLPRSQPLPRPFADQGPDPADQAGRPPVEVAKPIIPGQ